MLQCNQKIFSGVLRRERRINLIDILNLQKTNLPVMYKDSVCIAQSTLATSFIENQSLKVV